MKELDSLVVLASDVLLAEQKPNDRFMSLVMRMFSTRVNSNTQGVTKDFIEEIVANQENYLCLPLYVDVPNLKAGNYKMLDHRYNKVTRTFSTSQVGGFVKFWLQDDPEYGTSLYGECRIPKRDPAICAAIKEMYD